MWRKQDNRIEVEKDIHLRHHGGIFQETPNPRIHSEQHVVQILLALEMILRISNSSHLLRYLYYDTWSETISDAQFRPETWRSELIVRV